MIKTGIKRFVIIAIFLFILGEGGYSQQAWKWQNPKPTGNDLLSIVVLDTQRFIAVGDAGTVVISSDGGDSCKVTSNVARTNASLRSIFYISGKAWVVGDSGIVLSSSDNGSTWLRHYYPIVNNKMLYSVWFASPDTGWIVGSDGVIIKTTDGGNSWQSQSSKPMWDFRTSYFLDPLTGWIGGERGILLRTTNGGNNWDSIYTGTITRNKTIYSILFKDVKTGWVAGSLGLLQMTTNGGDTSWISKGGLVSGTIKSIKYIAQNAIIGIANNTIIQSYETQLPPSKILDTLGINSSGMDMGIAANSVTGYIVGKGGEIWKTSVGGKQWFRRSKGPTINELKALSFIDLLRGAVVGQNGTILLTDNGGNTWNSVPSGTTLPLYDVDYVTQNVLYVCGGFQDSGIILKSTDGGGNWIGSLTTSLIRRIMFSDELHGCAIDSPKTILVTTDGGTNWSSRLLDSNYDLTGIFLLNNNVGWAVGKFMDSTTSSIIYKTTNGGDIWLPINTIQNSSINEITFISEQTGWAVGDPPQLILQTLDSGKTWHSQMAASRTPSSAFYALTMRDSLNGWVCGKNGEIYHTTNSGKYWFSQESETKNILNGIYFYDDLHGWTVGGNGAILWTDIGGGGPPPHPQEIPEKMELYQNYPNPFNPHVTGRTYFPFGSPTGNYLKKIIIYNLLGQRVKIIELNPPLDGGYVYDEKSGNQPPPSWDGSDDSGRIVASGIYFYRFVTSSGLITGKMLLIK